MIDVVIFRQVRSSLVDEEEGEGEEEEEEEEEVVCIT